MTTASPAFDGIRVRAAQTGLYDAPILHGRLADVTALTAALGAVIYDRHASLPRSNVGGWYQRPTCSTGVAAVGLADRAKEAKQPHISTVAVRRCSNGRQDVGERPAAPRPLNMGNAQPS